MTRRTMLLTGCAVATIIAATALGTATAAAATSNAQPGSVACTALSGTMKFDPPLVNGGTAAEVAAIRITVRGCVTSTGAAPKWGRATATIPMHTNNCAGLGQKTASVTSFAIRWSPTTDGSSEVRFTEFAPTKTADTGFRLGGAKTTVHGSYPGDNHGASSKAVIVSTTTASKLADACESASGLEVLRLDSGDLVLK